MVGGLDRLAEGSLLLVGSLPLVRPSSADEIGFLDFGSGEVATLFQKEGPFGHLHVKVSPDERWILYDEVALAHSELVLIDGFR